MGTEDHNKALAVAAKAALGSIGMIRKGRSRTWLADRGYMLGVVEFQPSAWSKGTYLNVSAMWLWQPIDHIAFEVEPRRVGAFVNFETSANVAADATAVANDARTAITALLNRFDGCASVIEYFRSSPRAGSAAFLGHLGIACGLLGDLDLARSSLDEALAARERTPSGAWNALAYLVEARAAAQDHDRLREWVTATLTETRAALKLPPHPDPLGDFN